MSDKGRVLIIDDERIVRDSLGSWLAEDGYEVESAESASAALTLLAQKAWDLALVDIRMPGTDGIELQRRMKEIAPDVVVIIMTGYASVETAVKALKNGAYDYVTKPFDPDEIAHTVRNALSHRDAKREVSRLREIVSVSAPRRELIGKSDAIRRAQEAIETAASSDSAVLITGEKGTGKELVARAIHDASPRRFHPFVVARCGILTDSVLASELFGHEQGAFPGAMQRKKGKFEITEGGTVFLDEIGDASLKTQTDLLGVLESREVTRVGSSCPTPVDFRCIAATSKILSRLAEDGLFRLDLYYRLNVVRIDLPPLRERREDIPQLVDHFVRKFSLAMNKRVQRVAPKAMARIQQHDWPGNVRELENAVERALVVSRGAELGERDFTLTQDEPGSAVKTLADLERDHVLRVMEECGNNQTRAAEMLGIDRVTLQHKLKRYGWSQKPITE